MKNVQQLTHSMHSYSSIRVTIANSKQSFRVHYIPRSNISKKYCQLLSYIKQVENFLKQVTLPESKFDKCIGRIDTKKANHPNSPLMYR